MFDYFSGVKVGNKFLFFITLANHYVEFMKIDDKNAITTSSNKNYQFNSYDLVWLVKWDTGN